MIRLSKTVTEVPEGGSPSQFGAVPCETTTGKLDSMAPLFPNAACMDCEVCESVVAVVVESANVTVA